MPVYEYRCGSCGAHYDVLHLTREVIGDVVCPSCGSRAFTKLISAPSMAVRGSGAAEPGCGGEGGCCGGACRMD